MVAGLLVDSELISLLLPTRGRPELVERFFASLLETISLVSQGLNNGEYVNLGWEVKFREILDAREQNAELRVVQYDRIARDFSINHTFPDDYIDLGKILKT